MVATLAPGELFTLTGPARSTRRTARSTSRRSARRSRSGSCRGRRRSRRPATALARLARERELPQLAARGQEKKLLADASCLNDQVPTAEATDLSPFVPFLLPS